MMGQETNISYLPFWGVTGLTYGNGLTLTQGYDNQYRMASVAVGSILNLTYGFDANDNATSILDAINPPGGEALETQGAYSYLQGSNKLANINAAAPINFGYDPNGNITSENTRTLVYDLSNQLIQILDGSNQTAAYTYNGIGQRIMKVTQTGTRIFHYDVKGHLIAETNQSGQMLGEYIYLGDRLLAMIRPGEVAYYFHNDHLGTPQVLTNDSQAIAWKATYTPFGKAQISIGSVDNPFRFSGQYYDTETGLHYNYHRYYDPMTGRYITPDPIGLEGGVNLFSYVTNNPINIKDPLGLQVDGPLPRPCPLYVDTVTCTYYNCVHDNPYDVKKRCECECGVEGAGVECVEMCMDCWADPKVSPKQACLCACRLFDSEKKNCQKICKGLK